MSACNCPPGVQDMPFLIENFKSSVSLIKVYGRIKVRLKRQKWRRKKPQKPEEIQGTAKTVLQSFRKAFSGEFLSINTGHTLGHAHSAQDYKQLCPGSDTETGSKAGYQAGSIWN